MQITAAQLGAISERHFEERLATIVAGEDPQARTVLGSPEGRQMLRRQCRCARGYGLESELDIARFVITAWLLGPGFDTRFPAMAQVLTAPQLDPGTKSEFIERICTAVLTELNEGRA